MKTLLVGSFNINQFDIVKGSPHPLAHQLADLETRLKTVDILLVQECVHLDLVAIAARHPGWSAFQQRSGNNDGHANTGVLYKTSLGPPLGTTEAFLGDLPSTRARYLAGVDLTTWACSGHIFPDRDKAGIPTQLDNLGKWVKAHSGPVIIGMDRNQCPPGALENATGLKWVGIGIDGFLTNCKIANLKEFPKGFSDHAGVYATVSVPVAPAPDPGPHVVHPPNPPYIPSPHVSQGLNKPKKRIVLHSTVSACVPGGARAIAAFFQQPSTEGSSHYVHDPNETIQCVYDDAIAWHAPGAGWSDKDHPLPANIYSLGNEMCDTPGPLPNDKPGTAAWKAAKRSWRWIRPNQIKMLHRTARSVARQAAAYDVPVQFLTVKDLKAGKEGITTHNNVSRAFHQSTHWDPGFWPRRYFMAITKRHYKKLMAGK